MTDASGVVISANPAAVTMLEPDVLVGAIFEELPTLRGASVVETTDHEVVRRTRLMRSGGPVVMEIVSAVLAAHDGQHVHAVRDVTAQAELVRLKEDFMLQVAHELRTPIAALSASLDLVLQDALTMPRDQLAVMVRTLSRSAMRLETLVENLLDAGSIEAGTFQVRPLPTFLGRATQAALALVQTVIDLKQQTVNVTVARTAETVVADPRLTAQVLTNLLLNASRYSPEGAGIEVTAVADGGYVRVTAKDDGPGIPLDEQLRLFEHFFRSREVRDQAGGLGLGLTICHAIVHAQGGEIGITSEPGRGTSVHFTIPKARERTAEVGPT
ncbi:MAG: HAMP domain-containing histidine kinase [Chloroflexi bacterium]|nr:HAMP domain-containing histidine kinase [Chloroflexota bacterium]